MLYLGIDQHARQITISLRNDDGDVLQARQVTPAYQPVGERYSLTASVSLRNSPNSPLPSRQSRNSERFLGRSGPPHRSVQRPSARSVGGIVRKQWRSEMP